MMKPHTLFTQIAAAITFVVLPGAISLSVTTSAHAQAIPPLEETPLMNRGHAGPESSGPENPDQLLQMAPLPERTMPKAEAERERKRYNTCIKQVDTDPQGALESAQSWLAERSGLPAKHCMAVAMIALGSYEDAAEHLRMLADSFRSGQGLSFDILAADNPYSLIAGIYAQMGNALLMADKPHQAYNAFSQGLAELPAHDAVAMQELYVDRARALATTGDYAAAVKDLDQARLTGGWRADIALYLASAHRMNGEFDPAYGAIRRAMEMDPDNPAIYLEQGNIHLLLGQDANARTDWQTIVLRWPQSIAARAARANLKALAESSKAAGGTVKD